MNDVWTAFFGGCFVGISVTVIGLYIAFIMERRERTNGD